MTEKEAAKKTKYFGEGIHVGISCYSGEGTWALNINRDGSVYFNELDTLRRSIMILKMKICRGDKQIDLWQSQHCEIVFNSSTEAWLCVTEIKKAIEYIQSQTKDTDWHEIPSDLFDEPKITEAVK